MRYFIHVLMPYVEDEVLGVECVELLKIILVDVYKVQKFRPRRQELRKVENAQDSQMTFLEQLQPLMCTLLNARSRKRVRRCRRHLLQISLFLLLDKSPEQIGFHQIKSTYNVLQAMEYVSPISMRN